MEHVHLTVRNYFATLHWRGRVLTLALIVGLLCGIVAVLYEMVMDFVLEIVWREGGELFKEKFAFLPPWTYILIVCTLFGPLVGLLIRVCGEPMANLPGVVLAAHKDGLLGHEEAPAMAAISIASIVGAGSLGPEAPLVSIGGGLASLVSIFVDLTEAETLFVTMCGMGAGLAAFFGEPVGGALFACEVLHRYGLEYYEAVRAFSPALERADPFFFHTRVRSQFLFRISFFVAAARRSSRRSSPASRATGPSA